MKRIILLSLILLLCFNIIADTEYITEKVFFVDMSKYYGYSDELDRYFGNLLKQNNHIYIQDPDYKNGNFLIFKKFDLKGNYIEDIQYGNYEYSSSAVLIDEEENVYLLSSFYPHGRKDLETDYMYLFKFDKTGKELWRFDTSKLKRPVRKGFLLAFSQEGNIVISGVHTISPDGELLESIPSVIYDENGNYYDLRTDFNQNGIANGQAYIHIYNKSGVEINKIYVGDFNYAKFELQKINNKVYVRKDTVGTRTYIKYDPENGKELERFDGSNTYADKKKHQGVRITDNKGPKEMWTRINDYDKKGIWIIKKTRVDK